jgi:hypothetical protein
VNFKKFSYLFKGKQFLSFLKAFGDEVSLKAAFVLQKMFFL